LWVRAQAVGLPATVWMSTMHVIMTVQLLPQEDYGYKVVSAHLWMVPDKGRYNFVHTVSHGLPTPCMV
jgi:hypothetical protein